MKSKLLGVIALVSLFGLSPAGANAAQLVSNGDFATGDFTNWTQFTTSANGTLGSAPDPQVVSFDVTGGGSQLAAEFNVGAFTFTGLQEGGGIFQNITTTAGLLNFSASVASYDQQFNASAGVFEALLDGTVMASWDPGEINGPTVLRDTLSFSTAVTAGSYQLEILITRPFNSCGNGCTPNEYVTNISATEDMAATPLPAALPLFASGLGALGLLGWLRKRKAQAAA